ncbi:MAG: hypothetical protein ACK55Z_07235, partial [bacterium]
PLPRGECDVPRERVRDLDRDRRSRSCGRRGSRGRTERGRRNSRRCGARDVLAHASHVCRAA